MQSLLKFIEFICGVPFRNTLFSELYGASWKVQRSRRVEGLTCNSNVSFIITLSHPFFDTSKMVHPEVRKKREARGRQKVTETERVWRVKRMEGNV